MIAKFLAGELHSCLHHSSELPCFFGGDFDLWRSRVYLDSTIQPTKLQDRACKIELADLGLKFPLVESILIPVVNVTVVSVQFIIV